MEVDRPAPGEELNRDTQPTVPRQAATVIVLRGDADALDVLLVKRNPRQRFMGGAWVFPGGAVDREEAAAEGERAHRVAGVREVAEEVGIALDGPDELIAFSRWITPAQIKIRFDTHFFLAPVPADARPRVDGAECVDWAWLAPQAALDAYAADSLELVFPTIKTLEALAGFHSAVELLRWAQGREVVPVQPRVVVDGEVARVVLPGEPGYQG